MIYTIRHIETLVGYFDIEADDESSTIEKFRDDVSSGKIDFSDMEMIESYDTAATIEGDPW